MIGDRFGEILASAQRGEEPGFSAIYRDLAGAVRGFARGRGVEDPDEALAETMLSVARGIAKFTGTEAEFRSWVFTIAYRRVADARRRSFRRIHPQPLDPGSEPPDARQIDEEIIAAHGDSPIELAVKALKPDQRDVVLLHVVAGLPLANIAHLLKKSESAVKMIHLRGLARLRSELEATVTPGPSMSDSDR